MTDEPQYEYDIFISYNQVDEAWAQRLATRLEKEDRQDRKLKVFFAPWDIKPGESIPERLEYALPRSRKVGLILSPESVESEWVKVERYVTQYIDINERQKRLIPLYRRTCEIPFFLNHINYIDFQDEAKFEENYRILLATIREEPLPRGEQIFYNREISTAISDPIDDELQIGLKRLNELEQQELIDKSIKREYQRILLDRWIERLKGFSK
jgi:hypothetical protein